MPKLERRGKEVRLGYKAMLRSGLKRTNARKQANTKMWANLKSIWYGKIITIHLEAETRKERIYWISQILWFWTKKNWLLIGIYLQCKMHKKKRNISEFIKGSQQPIF